MLLVFSLMIEDVKLNEFIDALSSMVGYWSCISFHEFEFSMVVEFTWFRFLLMFFISLMSLHVFLKPQKLTKWVS